MVAGHRLLSYITNPAFLHSKAHPQGFAARDVFQQNGNTLQILLRFWLSLVFLLDAATSMPDT